MRVARPTAAPRSSSQARDGTGADKRSEDDEFEYIVNGALQPEIAVAQGDGLYLATFTLEQTGPVDIVVLHRGLEVPLDLATDAVRGPIQRCAGGL